jgi:hypothetical protein
LSFIFNPSIKLGANQSDQIPHLILIQEVQDILQNCYLPLVLKLGVNFSWIY